MARPASSTTSPLIDDRVCTRLEQLAAHLGEAEWLDGEFSAGDLLMVSVLMRLDGSELLAGEPALTAFLARGKARPAFSRAFAAQYAVFERSRSS